jgi:hypothetical protein
VVLLLFSIACISARINKSFCYPNFRLFNFVRDCLNLAMNHRMKEDILVSLLANGPVELFPSPKRSNTSLV